MTWDPAEHGFEPGDKIDQQIEIYAGGISLPMSNPEVLSFTWKWEETILDKALRVLLDPKFIIFLLVLVGIYALINVYYLYLFGFRPASLANARFWAKSIPLLPEWAADWIVIALSRLCCSRRVSRAWTRKFAAGEMKLDALNEYARKPLLDDPQVLDTWVTAHTRRVHSALGALPLYNKRCAYIPKPVRVVETGTQPYEVEHPDPSMLREIFCRRAGADKPAVICITGQEGSGKSTLACAIADWAMADDPTDRLASYRMIPVFIVQDMTDLRIAVKGRLRAMMLEEMPEDLIDGLLKHQRLLVIIDGLSERKRETQECVDKIYQQLTVYPRALVITSRAEPKDLDVERTCLELLNQGTAADAQGVDPERSLADAARADALAASLGRDAE